MCYLSNGVQLYSLAYCPNKTETDIYSHYDNQGSIQCLRKLGRAPCLIFRDDNVESSHFNVDDAVVFRNLKMLTSNETTSVASPNGFYCYYISLAHLKTSHRIHKPASTV